MKKLIAITVLFAPFAYMALELVIRLA